MILPITSYKEEIISAVASHDVTIVTAETGSGKTTQIPQYLAPYYQQVIVTQPRIMAAKTQANRVAEEMGATLGKEVGYKTGYDKCYSENSKIIFCTDGLQVVKTMLDTDVTKQSVLIIDEVHEWNINMENLIAWCKYMQGKWNMKVVIMSATLETKQLSDFFHKNVTVLTVPGTLYDVTVEERQESELISTIKEQIEQNKTTLVFVPGKREISEVMSHLKEQTAVVLPLHAELDWEEQKKCFESYNYPKVIVATNVAQTSITIPDVDVVVDTGKARVTIAENGIQGLFLVDISQADIMQRKGRAGRTKEGKYILCSDTPICERPKFQVPEIQRSILDRVVLQLASIGIDAQMLEFYHQPSEEAIATSKKVLTMLGAMDKKGAVTPIGHQMVKMPVSVQLSRMIVEAEKYGVTQQVVTIAAIIEMGGLLEKNTSYAEFTWENDSDLLAELDVWNHITQLGYIDFERLGIRKKNFFRIKEHLKKLREALYGIVEMHTNDDRKTILKACLCGMTSNIYVRYDGVEFYGEEEYITRKLDRKSCVKNSYYEPIDFVVGIPKTIEVPDYLGGTNHLNLLSFVSKVSKEMILELAPDRIQEKVEYAYASCEDAVRVTTIKSFLGKELQRTTHLDYQSPHYADLKVKYEWEVEEAKKRQASYYYSYYSTPLQEDNEQKSIEIGTKKFTITYGWDGKPRIYLDIETLFTCEEKELFLEDGRRVYVRAGTSSREETNLTALRNAIESEYNRNLYSAEKRQYGNVRVTTLKEATQKGSRLGKILLTMDKMGYGDTPIFVYGCLSLKKNTVALDVVADAELAEANTQEALQHLFMKEVAKQYTQSKFSHQQGKKKKVLTQSEQKVKEDFDSFVRECLREITIENALENMELLEEYYQELMAK